MTVETFVQLYTALLLVSTAIAASVSYVSWHRRHAPGALALCAVTVGQIIWCLAFAFALMHVPRPEPLFWTKVTFIGVVIVPAGYLLFALQYSNNNKWVTKRTIAILAIEPILVQLFSWSDPWHNLFYGGFIPGRDKYFIGGPAFWVHSAYSYLLTLTAAALLTQRCLRAPPAYRKQALIMLLSGFIPMVANIVTIFRIAPLPTVDFTPIGFTIGSLITAFALFRYKLLDLVPVAREAVVDRMQDGVLVIDAGKRVVDYNPAARDLLNLNAFIHGEPLRTALAAWPQIIKRCETRGNVSDELLLERGQQRYIDLRITDLHGGRLVVMRDITNIKAIESELRHANERLRQKLGEIEALQARLKEQAIRDPLTGLYNRRFLEESLARELANAERGQTPLSVAVIDLDHFKHVNDVHGHAAGDRLLEAIGDMLRQNSRGGDIACRYGGEEFVMIMPGATLDAAAHRVNEWRQAFAALHVQSENVYISTTFSAGVATYPLHGETTGALLDAADQALYAAKAAGRNRVMPATAAAAQRRTQA